MKWLLRYAERRVVGYIVVGLTSMLLFALCGHHSRW